MVNLRAKKIFYALFVILITASYSEIIKSQTNFVFLYLPDESKEPIRKELLSEEYSDCNNCYKCGWFCYQGTEYILSLSQSDGNVIQAELHEMKDEDPIFTLKISELNQYCHSVIINHGETQYGGRIFWEKGQTHPIKIVRDSDDDTVRTLDIGITLELFVNPPDLKKQQKINGMLKKLLISNEQEGGCGFQSDDGDLHFSVSLYPEESTKEASSFQDSRLQGASVFKADGMKKKSLKRLQDKDRKPRSSVCSLSKKTGARVCSGAINATKLGCRWLVIKPLKTAWSITKFSYNNTKLVLFLAIGGTVFFYSLPQHFFPAEIEPGLLDTIKTWGGILINHTQGTPPIYGDGFVMRDF